MGEDIPEVDKEQEVLDQQAQASAAGAAQTVTVRDPNHFSSEEIAAAQAGTLGKTATTSTTSAAVTKAAAGVPPPRVPAQTAAAAAAPDGGGGSISLRDLNCDSPATFYRQLGALTRELQTLRAEKQARAGGQAPGPEQRPSAERKATMARTYWDALGMTEEEFNQRGQLDPVGLFGQLNAHHIEHHPAVQAAIEARVKAIIAPFEQQLQGLGQFKEQTAAERELDEVGGVAKKALTSYMVTNPELKANPAALAEFNKIVEDEIEEIYEAAKRGKNPFERIGAYVMAKNRATASDATAAAAQQRMKQVGALVTTPRVNASAASNNIPANKNERSMAVGRSFGLDEDTLASFAKACKNFEGVGL